ASGVDRAGDRLPSVPDWLASVTADYTHTVFDDVEVTWSAQYRYVGDYLGQEVVSGVNVPVDSFDIVNASIAAVRGPLEFRLFVENLLDDFIITNSASSSFLTGATFDGVYPRRRIGMSLSARF
ncbi:MAG: TonB-dependent receptor, partial [Pseudomonadota bacterium]